MIHPLKIGWRKKWTRDINEQSTEKELQISYYHKEKCLVSSKMREMQGKTTLRDVTLSEKREGAPGCVTGSLMMEMDRSVIIWELLPGALTPHTSGISGLPHGAGESPQVESDWVSQENALGQWVLWGIWAEQSSICYGQIWVQICIHWLAGWAQTSYSPSLILGSFNCKVENNSIMRYCE